MTSQIEGAPFSYKNAPNPVGLTLLKIRNVHHLIFDGVEGRDGLRALAILLDRHPVPYASPLRRPGWADPSEVVFGLIGISWGDAQYEVEIRPVDERGLLDSQCTCKSGLLGIVCNHVLALAVPALLHLLSRLTPLPVGMTEPELAMCTSIALELAQLIEHLSINIQGGK